MAKKPVKPPPRQPSKPSGKTSDSAKLTRSSAVYDRLRWDPGFAGTEVYVCYEDRFAGMIERPLAEFIPGRIPWARVWQFRTASTVLWDRKARIDRVFGSGDTPSTEIIRALAPQAPPAAELTALTPYRYCSTREVWKPALPERIAAMPREIRAVTYNVLHHLYEPDPQASIGRITDALPILERTDADLIALQEVTPRFLGLLAGQAWVRRAYILSATPNSARTLDPLGGRPPGKLFGIMLLSRLPLCRLGYFADEDRIRAVVAQIQVQADAEASTETTASTGSDSGARSLLCAAVHLTSDYHPHAQTMRTRQLAGLLGGPLATLPSRADILILGDVNFGDEHRDGNIEARGLVDAWEALKPREPGYTFDPKRNPVAAHNSLTGLSRRLDRVFTSSPGLVPTAIALIGDRTLDGSAFHASDHFGLLCTISVHSLPAHDAGAAARPSDARADAHRSAEHVAASPAEVTAVQPVYRSAVVLMPPPSLWPAIQAVRHRYDRHVDRWMPHINLLYGFVPDHYFAHAATLIAEALRDVRPFAVTLADIDLFQHRHSHTMWLDPAAEPAGSLHAVQARLAEAFPLCTEQSRKSERGFTPHLSIGQAKSRSDADATVAALTATWRPLRFTAGAVCLISRRGDESFMVRHIVPFGAGDLAATLDIEEGGAAPRDQVVSAIQEALAACAPQAVIHSVGSARLGARVGDIDLAVRAPMPREDFVLALRAELAARSLPAAIRSVDDARTPVIELALPASSHAPGTSTAPALIVDILYADSTQDSQGMPHDVGAPVLRSIQDAEYLDAVARELGNGFSLALRAVSAWARARAVSAQAFGFPGGLARALLLAHAADTLDADRPLDTAGAEALVYHFFSLYAGWDWSRPVIPASGSALSGAPFASSALITIASPILPLQNTARTVSRSTLRVWRRELARARELVSAICRRDLPWAALFEPADPLAADVPFPAAAEPREHHTGEGGDNDVPARGCILIQAAAPTQAAKRAAVGWLAGQAAGVIAQLERDPLVTVRPFPLTPALEAGTRANMAGFVVERALPFGQREPAAAEALAAHAHAVAQRLERDFAAWSARPRAAELTAEYLDIKDAWTHLLPTLP